LLHHCSRDLTAVKIKTSSGRGGVIEVTDLPSSRNLEGGSCSRGSEGYERKALGMDRGSVWATCHEPIYWGLPETVGRVAGGGVFLSVGALRRL
jgi:hypothetical protein